MNNTKQPFHAKLTYILDQTVTIASNACSVKSSTLVTCLLPAGPLANYGEYLVSLEEIASTLQISDENILSLVILPKPNLLAQT